MSSDRSGAKRPFWRRNLDLLLVFIIFTPLYYAHVLTQPVSPFEPRNDPYAPYERHYQPSLRFPFITSYFLMVPENYRPEEHTYPMVVMLHGLSRHMYGGKVLARPRMRAGFPAFVLIPIAPFGFTWVVPKGFSWRPEALPAAMETVRAVADRYGVDRNRIYITGYSMGGIGTYAALTRYHDVFAAAVPTDAVWDPALVGQFDDVPVWIFHGALDNSMPAQTARAVARAMKQKGRAVFYTEFPRRGHGAWIPAYENPAFWDWLIQQKKS